MPVRPGLDRAVVVQAAAELIDRDGGHDLSLARVAACLGVRPPSLYNHIGGLDDLRHGLAVYGVRELARRLGQAAIGKSGESALRALLSAYRAFARERPGLYAATLRAPDPGDAELIAASEEVLSILRAVLEPYPLAETEMIHAMRGLRSLAHGFVALEAASGFGLPVDLDASFEHLTRTYLYGLAASTGRAGSYTGA